MYDPRKHTVVSLFDSSGTWSKPFRDAGYSCVRVDLTFSEPQPMDNEVLIEGDIMELSLHDLDYAMHLAQTDTSERFSVTTIKSLARTQRQFTFHDADVVLSATPCTCWSLAGTGHWKRWATDGTEAFHLSLFDHQMELVKQLDARVWALENPPGRLANKKGTGLRQDVLGKPTKQFQPWQYVDAKLFPDHEERYTKRTYLWGNCIVPAPDSNAEKPDNSKYKGHGRIQWLGGRNKALRSKTPQLFSKAFFEANRK